jgi:hypothetical protein
VGVEVLAFGVRSLAYLHLMTEQRAVGLRAVQSAGRWRLDGAGPADLPVINEFLGYVADRGYSPRTERAYAFDLLAFARWLVDQDLTVGGVTTDALLRFLTFCRAMVLPGQAGGNVVPLRTGRSTGYAPSTINRRMAAISGLFDFRAMRDPALVNPVPRSAAARRSSTAQRGGLLAHLDRPKSRSRLRVREPRRLPRGWTGPRPRRCCVVGRGKWLTLVELFGSLAARRGMPGRSDRDDVGG